MYLHEKTIQPIVPSLLYKVGLCKGWSTCYRKWACVKVGLFAVLSGLWNMTGTMEHDWNKPVAEVAKKSNQTENFGEILNFFLYIKKTGAIFGLTIYD